MNTNESERYLRMSDLKKQADKRYPLWLFFAQEHDLTLTEGQLDDIVYAVKEHLANDTTKGHGYPSPLETLANTTPQRLFDWLKENTCDLICVNQPTGGGDYEILWVIIQHYKANPQEREIGYGKTPKKAIIDAMKDRDSKTKSDYIPRYY